MLCSSMFLIVPGGMISNIKTHTKKWGHVSKPVFFVSKKNLIQICGMLETTLKNKGQYRGFTHHNNLFSCVYRILICFGTRWSP